VQIRKAFSQWFLILFAQCTLFNISAQAIIVEVGLHNYYSSDEIEIQKLEYLIAPKERIDFDSSFIPFPEESQILFLGDGFQEYDTSLCATVKQWVHESTLLYRTGIDCAEEQWIGNTIFKKVDHRSPLPFLDNQFTTIVLRKGLCHCHCNHYSCGGIENHEKGMTGFLSEVSRILDKKGDDPMAFLHGSYYRFCFHRMQSFYRNWEAAIEKTLRSYPELKIRMIHRFKGTPPDKVREDLDRGTPPEEMDSVFIGVSVRRSSKFL
jgi:hypothetical protein